MLEVTYYAQNSASIPTQQQGIQSVCALELHSDYTQPMLNSECAFIHEIHFKMRVEIHVTTCEYRLNKLTRYLLCKCFGLQTLDTQVQERALIKFLHASGTPPVCLYYLPPDVTTHDHIF